MNRKLGMYSSIVNACSVAAFALCMLIGFDFGSYVVCMFIAFSFVPMICAFGNYSARENRVSAYTAMIFSGIYAVMILLVYFAQVTAVRNGTAVLLVWCAYFAPVGILSFLHFKNKASDCRHD